MEEGVPPAQRGANSAAASGVKTGDVCEVYSRHGTMLGVWCPAVVTGCSGAVVTVSYTIKEDIARGSPTLRLSANEGALSAKLSDPKRPGAVGSQEMLDRLPALEEGFRYHQVQKAGGIGRAGGGITYYAQAGRTGIVLYTVDTGEHFKTYSYEDLKSWEAGPSELVLEKRVAKKTMGQKQATHVAFSTKKGEAMILVECIMKQVGRVVDGIAEAAEALGLARDQRSKASLNRNYNVKKAAGKGRGKVIHADPVIACTV
jgi:hypothetical protein